MVLNQRNSFLQENKIQRTRNQIETLEKAHHHKRMIESNKKITMGKASKELIRKPVVRLLCFCFIYSCLVSSWFSRLWHALRLPQEHSLLFFWGGAPWNKASFLPCWRELPIGYNPHEQIHYLMKVSASRCPTAGVLGKWVTWQVWASEAPWLMINATVLHRYFNRI